MKATKFSDFLQPREKLKFVDRPHWIYVFSGAMWALALVALGFFTNTWVMANFVDPISGPVYGFDAFLRNVMGWTAVGVWWACVATAIVVLLHSIIYYRSTYVFSTDRRLFVKRGLIWVRVTEVSYSEIRKTDINYGLIGRFLGYGKLLLDARFVENSQIPFVPNPEQFEKIINYYNDLETDMNYTYITRGMKEETADDSIATCSECDAHTDPLYEQENFAMHVYEQQAHQVDGDNPDNIEADEKEKNLRPTGKPSNAFIHQ